MKTISPICRTCLQQINGDNNCKFNLKGIVSLTPIGCMLAEYLPEMDLSVTSSPVICGDCFSAIQLFNKLKTTCLKTEARIQSYIQKNPSNLASVDLRQVVKVNELQRVNVTNGKGEPIKVKKSANVKEKKEKEQGQCTNTKLQLVKLVSCNDSIQNYEMPRHAKVMRSETKTAVNILYKCAKCEFSTHLKGNLKTHEKIHSAVKPYKCTDCGYRCLQKQHLVVHMRRHTGEKPYKCRKCSYRCRQPANLEVHMNTHSK